MKAKTVFVDTSMFKALTDEKDEFHQKATLIWNRLQKEKYSLITSNYILDEAFTLIRLRRGVAIVDEFRKALAGSSDIKFVRVTLNDESKAWKYFLTDWSGLSFTDCISFAMMKRLDILSVATFDKHFEKAGFRIV